jgi:uncharacterized RDD family membrane protein YckC
MDMTMDDRMGRLPNPDDKPEAGYYRKVTSKRLVAWIVDSILIAILCALLIPFTAFTAVFFLPFFWLIVGVAYRVLTLAAGSATWGMRFAGIELRREDGSKFNLATALVHTLLYSLFMAMFILQMISIVLMLTTARRQGLHDMILRTAAIRREV